MAIDRRTLLAGLGAAALTPSLQAAAAIAEDTPLFLACAEQGGTYTAILFDETGRTLAEIALPGRGHGYAVSPDKSRALVFARRPGNFALAVRTSDGRLVASFEAPEGRHFYGHGCFSRDGRLLYTTENDYDNERGVIGIWNVDDGFTRVGEWDSYGIGPHDISLLPGSDTLVVANGGIFTHPETGRTKLNIPDMDPSLALIDRRNGTRMAECRLPHELHKLSIRHLAVNAQGTIAAAMQYEGSADDTPPLLLSWTGDEPVLFTAPAGVQQRMHNYCGSVAMDTSGRIAAASCPRGNLITFWDVATANLVHTLEVRDGCGLSPAPGPNRFLITSGFGERLLYDAVAGKTTALSRQAGTHWDNHVSVARS